VQTKAATVKLCQVKVDNLQWLTVAFDWGSYTIHTISSFYFSWNFISKLLCTSIKLRNQY